MKLRNKLVFYLPLVRSTFRDSHKLFLAALSQPSVCTLNDYYIVTKVSLGRVALSLLKSELAMASAFFPVCVSVSVCVWHIMVQILPIMLCSQAHKTCFDYQPIMPS